MALQSLSKEERKAVITDLLEDIEIGEDILDLALIRRHQGEPASSFHP